MNNFKKIRSTVCLLMVIIPCLAQERGMPFIRNFPPSEYRSSQQNWAIVQDPRGTMFIGTNDGLLEYDGITWRLTKLPGVRSLATDTNGRIYAGLENDIGYLAPDRKGSFIFHSLKDKMPESERDLTTVFKVFCQGDLLIFQTTDRLFLLRDGMIKIIKTPFSFHLSFSVNDKFYVRQPGSGLYTLAGDTLQFINGSEFFGNERIYSMLPGDDNKILIATRTKGIVEWSPGTSENFFKSGIYTEVDDFLNSNPVYCGTKLANGDYVLGSMTNGLIIFDKTGKILSRYNKNNGLQDNTVLWLYPDKNQQLWAALDNGISLIQNNLPFRYYSASNGLNGSPMAMKFFNGHFYVGTGQSLHIQDKKGNFEEIPGTVSQNFCLYDAEGTLLLAQYIGLFKVDGERVSPIRDTPENSYLSFCPLGGRKGFLLAGGADGVYLLRKEKSDWHTIKRIPGFNKSAYKIDQDREGNLWISNIVELYRLRLSPELDSVVSVTRYNAASGLPSDYSMPFTLKSGEVVFGTERGIFRFISDREKFEPHPDFTMLTGNVLPFEEDERGDIWFDQKMVNGDHEKGVLRYVNGKYEAYMTPFFKFGNTSSGDTPFSICPAPDGTVFFGTNVGLLQYDPRKEFSAGHSFLTLIRSVNSTDSILFAGAHLKLSDTSEIKGGSIPYRQHNMVVTYSAAFYEDSEKNLYSCRMLGLDTAWSKWTSDHKKEYTNLREGKYTFQVRSMNQYQKKGSVASYSFSVLPPWYRTWWAYLSYVLMSVMAIWVIVQMNIQRLVAQKKQLENIVSQRTTEVVRQKEEIEVKNRELNDTLGIVNYQKMQIENAHEEITASINYAKYIQSSVLPREEELTGLLGDHFILQKPAEIIGGDFYWISSVSGKIVLAVADCTGHGVPGAFMSMLGIALLNEIVNKETITDPGIILDHLRQEVTSSLRQKGERQEQKDGMDIAICTIDRKAGKLRFAGANNPMYILRNQPHMAVGIQHPESNNDQRLIEVKGDLMPIGITDEMQSFSSHEIDILENDRFYLFTDGFPDQFGGSDHKKFSYKRFRELLVSTATLGLADQKTVLEKALEKWMGRENQTDDILVIGFQILS